ncbi:MAG: hypothetical protein RLZZ40_6, partial [Actinomycetota bacterium]
RGNGKAFCAGADLDMMASITDRANSLALAQQGHAVLGRLSELGVPVVAEINGVALGGGLELALHCTHRVVGRSVTAIGLPEISLGLIPGWGGATLLPRLVGFERAVTVLLDNPIKSNALLNASTAHSLGIVDLVLDDEHLHEDVLRFIDDGCPVDRSAPSTSREQLDALREKVTGYSTRPGNPHFAMSRLLDVLATEGDISDGFRAEDEALADTIVTSEFRNRVYSFHLTTSRARKPAGVPSVEPREISSIGVIGAGLMASQFAALFAERLRIPVLLTDVSQERLDAAVARIGDALQARVDKGSLSASSREEILGLLSTTLNKADFSSCDFVMEAVFEDMAVKVDVLRSVEEYVSSECILATNTSSLSVTKMAESLHRPERLIGFHFFNPVAVMPLIEVVATTHTTDEALATAIRCAGNLRKTAVITKDLAGFVVNRLLSVFLSEALDAVDGGASTNAVTSALAPMRLPMDPFALIDLIGRPVTLHMIESLNRFCPDRVQVSPTLLRLTEHPVSSSLAADIGSAGDPQGDGVHSSTCDALALEIGIMLDEGVVADVKDIDLCLITGANWPVAHGGISRYLDVVGASERVNGRRFHR